MANLFKNVEEYMYDMDIAPTLFTPEEAKAEYARLAKVVNRNITQIKKSRDFSDSAAGERDLFPENLDGLTEERHIYYMLKQVAQFAQKKTSTLAGLREAEQKALETLHKHEYDFVNQYNIHDFRKFWEEVRRHKTASSYDSERIANLFKTAVKKRISREDMAKNFDFWLEHEKKLSTMKRSSSTISSDEAKERLGLT